MLFVTSIISCNCLQQRRWLAFHLILHEHYRPYTPTHTFEYMAKLMPPTPGVGTRPGDPFADVVFGYMFARLLTMVEQKMQELDILETIHDVGTTGLFPDLHAAPIQPHSILGPTWMDDLCITVTSSTAHGVENKAGLAASVLLETCMNHGVTPNLQKGKTEILLSFRGQGSRILKQKYFSPQQGQRMTILTEYGTTTFQSWETTPILVD